MREASSDPPHPILSHPGEGNLGWWARLAVITAITAAGAGLRIYHLGYKSLWVDEAILYWLTRGSFAQTLHANASGNSAPPLFALAIHGLTPLGESEAALRALSCAAGIAALPALYLLCRRFLTFPAAAVCTLMAAIAPGQIVYSQQVREYSLTVLCTAAILYCFHRHQQEPSWRNWTALATAMVTGIFLQYGLALLVLALNFVFALELVSTKLSKTLCVRWVLANVAGAAAAAAVWHLALKSQFTAGGFGANYLGGGYWNGSLYSLVFMVFGNTYELFALAFPVPLLLQFLVLLGWFEARRSRHGQLAILLFAVPMLTTFAAACVRYYPYIGARQDIFLTVMIYVLAGFGVQAVRQWDRRGALALTLYLGFEGVRASLDYLESTYPQHVRPIAEAVAAQRRDGDRVYVYQGAGAAFSYYYRRDKDWIRGVYSPGQPAPQRQQIDQILAEPGRVWLVFTNCWPRECQEIRQQAATRRALRTVIEGGGAELLVAE